MMKVDMSRYAGTLLAVAGLVLVAGCGTTAVDMDEESRVLGFENEVRVDALFYGLTGSGRSLGISVVYEIENRRGASIAFADMVPISSFDGETGTFTVIVGSEVPGQEMLPRLIEIKPGERVSLSTSARLVVPSADPGIRGRPPRDVRLKVVYLEDVEPFRELVGIPTVAVKDPARADELFLPWVEGTRSVTTNGVPLRSRARGDVVPDRSAVRP
jgi:hypothetical protein